MKYVVFNSIESDIYKSLLKNSYDDVIYAVDYFFNH